MIGSEVGKMWFKIATILVVFSIIAMLAVQPGSAEFYVSLLALGIGALLLIMVAVLVRKSIK